MSSRREISVKQKVENLFFDLQRKMMEFERMEMHSTDEEMHRLNYPFIFDNLNTLQRNFGDYLEINFKWNQNKAMEKFYRSRWYQAFERVR
jgi:hypothetical protein